jgi:hypothetical protein
MKRWENELNRVFPKEEVQMAKKYMKKCSPSLAIKGNANQNHLTSVRMTIIKNTNNKCWWGCWGKRNPYTLLVGM